MKRDVRVYLIHEYFGVNLKRAFKVVKKDIPDFKAIIIKIQSNRESER